MGRSARAPAPKPLSDQVVFLTGAAGGVGAEVAHRLHRKGTRLLLVDLDMVRLNELAASLGEDRVMTAVADVRDLGALQSAADRAVERFGGIDTVVANAGILSYGSVRQVDPLAFKRVLDVNVLGVFHTVRAALPSLIDRRGYILVVSSLAAYGGAPGLASYSASKAGVEHFANTLRLELAYLGVDVGSAHMALIDTPLLRDAKADLATFREMLTMQGPGNTVTSVQDCGKAFVSGIEARKHRVNCPRWVGLARWLRPLLATPIGERSMSKSARELLPGLDAEVAALGRSMGARSDLLTSAPEHPQG
ncbi:short-chain dehydrogenase [Mycobacterium talmoniae]|uniref:Short-chain dehydrogenase n=2 Tax=Mycobacterium talmoniae TaxID=1858794 RepID=A0A1S1NDW4_9MYCO|nr:short-chain dehydrogenase [Mycobacterium talmoniae]TDH57244.1 SDR family oxidoreductase [Mycobacterium eburneum]